MTFLKLFIVFQILACSVKSVRVELSNQFVLLREREKEGVDGDTNKLSRGEICVANFIPPHPRGNPVASAHYMGGSLMGGCVFFLHMKFATSPTGGC